MDWSDLPSELLITIAGKLTEFTDHLRFRSVCSNWRSSSLSTTLRLSQQLPWLALPCTSSTSFYSLSEDRIYSNPPSGIPENSNIFGSASGWLLSLSISVQNRSITASLVNLFTRALIGLPSPDPRSSLSCVYVAPDTLVWDRSDTLVVAACSTRPGVFYCQLGGPAWALIESQRNSMASSITFHEGRFYIFEDHAWQIIVLDGETIEQIAVIAAPSLNCLYEAHLFVSSGELLLLVKHIWQIYKVQQANLNDQLVDWVKINDIGNRALFVDNLHCFLVEVGDNGMLRRNCIYSSHLRTNGTSRRYRWMYGILIFYLTDNSCECLEGALSNFPPLFLHSRGAALSPSWVLPSLN